MRTWHFLGVVCPFDSTGCSWADGPAEQAEKIPWYPTSAGPDVTGYCRDLVRAGIFHEWQVPPVPKTNACPSRDHVLLSVEEAPLEHHPSPGDQGPLAAGLSNAEKVVGGSGMLAFRERTLNQQWPLGS